MSSAPVDRPVAVVTGASSGIGQAVVHVLLARGFFVVATMRRVADAPGELVDSPHAAVRPLDVTSDASVAALAEWLRDDRNVTRCDVLVNNAGFGVPGTVETVPIEAAMRVFDVNVWGVVRMCKALLPVMRERGHGGLVVTVSSTSGVRGLPCTDFYAGSKFAVEGLMESMRYSVAPDNIKVALVNPGPVATKFLERFKREGVDSSGGRSGSGGEDDGGGRLPQGLGARMSARSTQILAKRIAGGQTVESCAQSVADVIARELPKRVDGGRENTVRFWNGTTDSANEIIAAVKREPTGCEGPVYGTIWRSAAELADSVRAEGRE